MPVKQTLCDLAEVILNKDVLNSSSLKAGSSVTYLGMLGKIFAKNVLSGV